MAYESSGFKLSLPDEFDTDDIPPDRHQPPSQKPGNVRVQKTVPDLLLMAKEIARVDIRLARHEEKLTHIISMLQRPSEKWRSEDPAAISWGSRKASTWQSKAREMSFIPQGDPGVAEDVADDDPKEEPSFVEGLADAEYAEDSEELNKQASRSRGPRVTTIMNQRRNDAHSRAHAEIARRSQISVQPDATLAWRVKQVTEHRAFEVVTVTTILTNIVLIGVEVDVESQLPLNQIPMSFAYLNAAYTVIFTLELVLRLVAEGGFRRYLCGKEWSWHIFDFLIVILAWFESVTSIFSLEAQSPLSLSHFKILRILRVGRVVRSFRIVRLFRFFASLRRLLISILTTARSLLWTLLLVTMIFFSTGVYITSAVTDYCREEAVRLTGDVNAAPVCVSIDNVDRYWSSLPITMYTLFKAISEGMSWQDAAKPLEEMGVFTLCVFLAFIAFSFFAMLNVVTGIFCQNAIEAASADREIATNAMIKNRQGMVEGLKHTFKQIDADDSNDFNIAEFESALEDERMLAFFQSIEVDVENAWDIFHLLDDDQDGSIDIEEFVSGCLKLRGSAKAVHLATMSYENKIARQQLKSIEESLIGMHADIMEKLSVKQL
eukprot:TRINITY_DN77592_c0_g1_i1.p1 TRINITY_DN77592_c0_g1~~TRINITY_DN77592_c0_g1_i1.p1  ORF type:complete len:618 (-),score=102.86 TRINITY_DN77592_c0_g1_i1:36-1850(-)